MVYSTGHNKNTRQVKGPSSLFGKAGIHDIKYDSWQRWGRCFKKLPNLYSPCPPGKRHQSGARIGKDSHKQSENKLFSTEENTI